MGAVGKCCSTEEPEAFTWNRKNTFWNDTIIIKEWNCCSTQEPEAFTCDVLPDENIEAFVTGVRSPVPRKFLAVVKGEPVKAVNREPLTVLQQNVGPQTWPKYISPFKDSTMLQQTVQKEVFKSKSNLYAKRGPESSRGSDIRYSPGYGLDENYCPGVGSGDFHFASDTYENLTIRGTSLHFQKPMQFTHGFTNYDYCCPDSLSEDLTSVQSEQIKEHIQTYVQEEKKLKYTVKKLKQMDSTIHAEIKHYKTPPESLQMVLACCVLVCGGQSTKWKDCKRFLRSKDQRNAMLDMKIQDLDPRHIANSQNYAKVNYALFEQELIKFEMGGHPENVQNVLLNWLLNIWSLHEQRSVLKEYAIDVTSQSIDRTSYGYYS